MKCSVFIAVSVDGFIAKIDGSVDWLQTVGNLQAEMKENPDMGFAEFFNTVDCMIMGRRTMEAISAMNLSDTQWPYGDTPVIVLSNTVKKPPSNLVGKVEIYSGTASDLISKLEREGHTHAYVDGGSTITSFINLKRINEITLTQVPVLLGYGISLFGNIARDVKLEYARATVFPNDFVQVKYTVKYL